MVDHVLLSKSVRRPHARTRYIPEAAKYDANTGLWVSKKGEMLAVRPPQTKKEDVETGEDVKGE
jgi:hypothetical protein